MPVSKFKVVSKSKAANKSKVASKSKAHQPNLHKAHKVNKKILPVKSFNPVHRSQVNLKWPALVPPLAQVLLMRARRVPFNQHPAQSIKPPMLDKTNQLIKPLHPPCKPLAI